MITRRLHIRRYADILMGSIINGAKTKIQKLAYRKGLELSKGQTEFNEMLRNNSPSIYLVDPNLIAKVILNKLNTESATYVSAVFTDEGPSSPENASFQKDLSSILLNNSGLEARLSRQIAQQLNADFASSKITSKELNDVVKTIYDKMIVDITAAEKGSKSYLSYQIAAAKAGAELRRVLNLKKVAILTDADSIVDNLNDRIAFVSYTFSAGVSNINKSIQTAVNSVLLSAGIETAKAFAVGNLVHAGHVGIYQDDNLIGINMPAAIIGGLVTGRFADIEQAIGNIPIHIEQGIRLKTNYTQSAGMFLDLQFNFAVSMEGSFNSGILGPQEVAAARAIVNNVANKALEEAVKEQVSATSISKVADILQASPNYREYLEQAIRATLEGKKLPNLNHQLDTLLKRDIVSSFTKSTKANLNTKKKIVAKNTKVPETSIKARAAVPDLTSLQSLINSSLFETIRKNMGDGTRSDVLNYRTGRFASSARVERLSQSRSGMITAFYTYMKNPYATFSDGGRQQMPKTRDPKLLISKSIREIAAERVANRLRAIAL